MRTLLLGLGLVLVCVGLAGCAQAPAAPPAAAPVAVSVSYPVQREITDYSDATGRVAAVDSVEVKAHVWGYLEKVNFKEGDLVKKGDVLFELDARPYEALLNQEKAKVRQDEAQLAFDEAEYQRNRRLNGTAAVSRSDLEKTAAAREVDKAKIEADKALVRQRELDLEYTKVKAPVSGRVGRYLVTVGNLIQAGDQGGGTVLTTIVSVDPIYAYFDVDERTVLRVREMIRAGKMKSARDVPWPVYLGLASEDGFPHEGTINFVDNQVNPKIGTLRVRGVFPNQDESLTPGYFSRIRVPIGPPRNGLLISDRAIDTDQGQKTVNVVGQDNKVAVRPVRLGRLHDGLRAIEDGLTASDRVIVIGLQQVRPGMTVEPTIVAMPGQKLKAEARTPNELPISKAK